MHDTLIVIYIFLLGSIHHSSRITRIALAGCKPRLSVEASGRGAERCIGYISSSFHFSGVVATDSINGVS